MNDLGYVIELIIGEPLLMNLAVRLYDVHVNWRLDIHR